MHVLIFLPWDESERFLYERIIAPRFPALTVQTVGTIDELKANIGRAEILMSFGVRLPPGIFAHASRLDWATLFAMPRIIRAFRGGDDHLLTGISRIFEAEGFHLLGAHEVAPDITAPSGPLGRNEPDAAAVEDIDRGFALLCALSPFDVGQAVDSVEDIRSAGYVNGKPAVMVILFREPGANIIDAVDSVREALPQVSAASGTICIKDTCRSSSSVSFSSKSSNSLSRLSRRLSKSRRRRLRCSRKAIRWFRI